MDRTVASVLRGLLLAAVLLAPTAFAAPTIFKCKDSHGGAVFSPTPCGKDAKEVDTSRALKTGTSPNIQGISDRAAMSRIDGDCAARSRSIDDRVAGEVATIDREIDFINRQMANSRNNAAGAIRNNGLRQQYTAAADRRAAAIRSGQTDAAALAKECESQRAAESKAEADRGKPAAPLAPPQESTKEQ